MLPMTIVIAITGASGVAYGARLLEVLKGHITLIVSDGAGPIIEHEMGLKAKDLEERADAVFQNDDLSAPVASGTATVEAMVIIPCSISTLGKVANGIADNLITRVATVCLKERWPLIVVPRETPLATVHLENMARLSAMGAIVLPASPGFYNRPQKVDDMVDFVVGKVMNVLGQEQDLLAPWGGMEGKEKMNKEKGTHKDRKPCHGR